MRPINTFIPKFRDALSAIQAGAMGEAFDDLVPVFLRAIPGVWKNQLRRHSVASLLLLKQSLNQWHGQRYRAFLPAFGYEPQCRLRSDSNDVVAKIDIPPADTLEFTIAEARSQQEHDDQPLVFTGVLQQYQDLFRFIHRADCLNEFRPVTLLGQTGPAKSLKELQNHV